MSERLRGWYQGRLEQADQDARAALGSAQVVEQLGEAMRRLAEAERRGLREAEHAAIVDVEIAEVLDRELLLRLVELDEAQGLPAAELEARLHALMDAPPEKR